MYCTVNYVMFKLTIRFESTTRTATFEYVTQLRSLVHTIFAKLENLSIHQIFNKQTPYTSDNVYGN